MEHKHKKKLISWNHKRFARSRVAVGNNWKNGYYMKGIYQDLNSVLVVVVVHACSWWCTGTKSCVSVLVTITSTDGVYYSMWHSTVYIVSIVDMLYSKQQKMVYLLSQVMELQEACQIHQGLLQGRNNSLQDMKAIVKTWRNRLPVIADDLSHWSDIFTWRQHHYQFIVTHYTGAGEGSQVTADSL